MYESHFGLNKKPFQITTDPGFLWMGTTHREALNTLKYGVMDNKGLLLLTGDVGTGKTTLINRLLEDVKDKVYAAKIPDPRLTKYDFYRMVTRYFKLPIEVRTKDDFIGPFTRFLSDARQEKKSVLLLIDEAQRLKYDLMEEIRLLSNLEQKGTKLLNIFFVGQNEFNGTLLQPENRALLRRITITYNIDPLTLDETGAYIRHRLKVAGAGVEIFSAGAVAEIYDFSNGFPRQINIISDLAMFFASQLDQRTISRKIVQQCRERISFNVSKIPAKPRQPAPAATVPPPPPAAAYRRPSARRWVAVGVALVLACAAGFYYATPGWRARARQWIGRPVENHATRMPIHPATADIDADASPDASVTPWTDAEPEAIRLPGPRLRVPGLPPEADVGQTIEPAMRPTSRPVREASGPTPEGDAVAVSPLPPDPADAVEWVLKRRYRENRPADTPAASGENGM